MPGSGRGAGGLEVAACAGHGRRSHPGQVGLPEAARRRLALDVNAAHVAARLVLLGSAMELPLEHQEAGSPGKIRPSRVTSSPTFCPQACASLLNFGKPFWSALVSLVDFEQRV